jgi:hypothetical protein
VCGGRLPGAEVFGLGAVGFWGKCWGTRRGARFSREAGRRRLCAVLLEIRAVGVLIPTVRI